PAGKTLAEAWEAKSLRRSAQRCRSSGLFVSKLAKRCSNSTVFSAGLLHIEGEHCIHSIPPHPLFLIKQFFIKRLSRMKRKVATPAGAARAEDPALSAAKEAAEAVPAESVHLERNDLENGMFLNSLLKTQPPGCVFLHRPARATLVSLVKRRFYHDYILRLPKMHDLPQ